MHVVANRIRGGWKFVKVTDEYFRTLGGSP